MTLAPQRWWLPAALALGLWLMPAAGGGARGEDAFEVGSITVDQSAASAAEAREKALAEGRRVGLRRLLERLVPQDQQRRLPSLGDQRIAELVQSFEVVRERALGTRYQAELAIRYEPQGVRALLAEAGLAAGAAAPAPVAAPARPLVVLPVLKRGSQRLLWEETNDWRAAWVGLPAAAAQTAMIVPLGDLSDLAAIDADRAALGDRPALEAIAARYGAGGAVVAEAEAASDTAGRPTLNVKVERRGDSGGGVFSQTFTAAPGEGPEAVMARAAAAIGQGIEERWVRAATVAGGSLDNAFKVGVPLTGLGDLVAVRQRLAEVAGVRRQVVLALSRERAVIEIDFPGGPEALQPALAARGLTLAADSQDAAGWRLGLAGSGSGDGSGGGSDGSRAKP